MTAIFWKEFSWNKKKWSVGSQIHEPSWIYAEIMGTTDRTLDALIYGSIKRNSSGWGGKERTSENMPQLSGQWVIEQFTQLSYLTPIWQYHNAVFQWRNPQVFVPDTQSSTVPPGIGQINDRTIPQGLEKCSVPNRLRFLSNFRSHPGPEAEWPESPVTANKGPLSRLGFFLYYKPFFRNRRTRKGCRERYSAKARAAARKVTQRKATR